MRVIEDRIVPFLAGLGAEGDIDDLVTRAAEQARVRFRAKAWALGALKAGAESSGFDSRLHVWGRPFLITEEDAEAVADWVLRFSAATPDTVDGLVVEQLRRLDPALAERVRPDMSGTLPEGENLRRMVSWKVELLRHAALALRAGRTRVEDPHSDDVHDAAGLLTGNAQFVLLEFVAALLPGWMDRGHTWPTRLGPETGAGLPAGFGGNGALLGRLPELLPDLDWTDDESIMGNYSVGGMVPPDRVPAARAWLTEHRDRLVGDDGYLETSQRKCREAFALADRIGGGFVEATEIYSGFEGKIN
ncbi:MULTISPECIES: hypothetical protein [unclassified Nocardia]|uniref:hypothetical protein n=1 Tax=unclassified Nocardia TaxID=2637762 RepID=UPI0024A7CBD5|nr:MULTISPECIES: hypothetical protein [unclassified Nocardia]